MILSVEEARGTPRFRELCNKKVLEQLIYYGPEKRGNKRYYHFAKRDDCYEVVLSGPDMRIDTNMYEIADGVLWEQSFPRQNKEGVVTGIHWEAARAWLIEYCSPKYWPIYDESLKAGRGGWLDKGEFVMHLGTRLLINGEYHPLNMPNREFIYEREREIPIADADRIPLTSKETRVIFRYLSCFDFETPLQRALVAGWLAVAPVCGSFNWRVHFWLAANSARGKSTLIKGLREILQVFCLHFDSAETTAAGIRQKLRSDACPVLFDEAEGNIDAALTLFRSSSTGGTVTKGTSSQNHVDYRVQTSAFLASIERTIELESDITRFITIDYKTSNLTGHQLNMRNKRLERLREQFTRQFSGRFFMRSVELQKVMEESRRVIADLLTAEFDVSNVRAADKYAIPLAGYWSLSSNEVITKGRARRMLESFKFASDITNQMKQQETPEHESKFQHLLNSVIEIALPDKGFTKKAISELLGLLAGEYVGSTISGYDVVAYKKSCEEALARYGLRYMPEHGGVFVGNTNKNLEVLMRKINLAKNWNDVFARFEGSKKPPQAIYLVTNVRSRGLIVPYVIEREDDIKAVPEPGRIEEPGRAEESRQLVLEEELDEF